MKSRKIDIVQIILIIFMFLITLTMLIPILHILARSLSEPIQSKNMSSLEIIPRGFSLINYKILFSNKALVPSIFNSIFITVTGTLLNILLTTLAAYTLTRPKFIGKHLFMVFFIIMMLFEPGIVPEYIVIKKLGLMGSQWSVILGQAVNVYYLVIMMRYFEEIPHAFYEAAKVDGAGHFRTLFLVACPLIKPAIATLTMFYGVLRWNEYFRSSIYISSIKEVPLQVILRKFIVDNDVTSIIGTQNILNYNDLAKIDYTALQYSTIIIAVVPILLLYPFILKFYTKNVTTGGIKE